MVVDGIQEVEGSTLFSSTFQALQRLLKSQSVPRSHRWSTWALAAPVEDAS